MLTSADFADLERRAEPLVTKNHHRFLSEALICLRRTRDPVAVFELLARMTGRPDELDALHDVRRWYEQLLARPGRLDLGNLELWLAWTRRLARIQESEHRHRQHPSRARPPARPTMTLDAQLRALRQRYPAPPPPPPAPAPPQREGAPPTPSAPGPGHSQHSPLPQTLAVLFAQHQDAVKMLKALTNQASPGRRPPRPIPLVPATGKFPAEFGPVVFDPTHAAAGIAAYLQALTKRHHGAAFPFVVADLVREENRIIARAILLDPGALG